MDRGYRIAVDGSGNAYLTGYTKSIDFPTRNPMQPNLRGDYDAFITKITPSGDALVYSTYLGGSNGDRGGGIAVDDSGNVYLAGNTGSTDFPTQNPLQPDKAGGSDAFITKITPSGDALVYSTYLGGSNGDGSGGIVVDDAGNVYVTGSTSSRNFPTQNAIQPNYGGGSVFGGDVYVTKITPSGDALVYSTYLGGSDADTGGRIAVDSSGNVYLTGLTWSTDFPTQNPFQPDFAGGLYDAFITKINPAGDALVYSTYLGGSDSDYGGGIAADGAGNAYLTGKTYSTDFPIRNPMNLNPGGGSDAFVTKINPSGDALVYSTYLGGSSGDLGRGIAVDGSGNVYLTGETSSTDFPTQNPIQPNYAGMADAFVTKIGGANDPVPDIKANGSDGPLFIITDNPVEITVSLYSGEMSRISDWWIGASTPYGSYWLDPSRNWVQSDSPPVSVGQYPLFDLETTSLLTRTLSPGYYLFFFILDDNPDGILDTTWDDYVVVSVFPWPLGLQTEELPDFDLIFQEKLRELTAK